jgi:hypothetical protein
MLLAPRPLDQFDAGVEATAAGVDQCEVMRTDPEGPRCGWDRAATRGRRSWRRSQELADEDTGRPPVDLRGRTLLFHATILEDHQARPATIDGAKIIGFDQDLRSIEAGKLADLVLLDRNRLDDIRNTNSVRYVMKNGELYDAETMDQVWPVQRKLPRFWWWEAGPKAPVTTNGK